MILHRAASIHCMSWTVSFAVPFVHSVHMGMACHTFTCNANRYPTPYQTAYMSYGLVLLACSLMRENTFSLICLNKVSEDFQLCTQSQCVWFAGWIQYGWLAEAMVTNSGQTKQSEQLFTVASIPTHWRKVLLWQNPTRKPPKFDREARYTRSEYIFYENRKNVKVNKQSKS